MNRQTYSFVCRFSVAIMKCWCVRSKAAKQQGHMSSQSVTVLLFAKAVHGKAVCSKAVPLVSYDLALPITCSVVCVALFKWCGGPFLLAALAFIFVYYAILLF